jgi:hypothetical protein
MGDMPLGFDKDLNVINAGDSAEIYAFIFDQRDVPIAEDDLLSVEFTIQQPDGTVNTATGEVTGDGEGFVRSTDTDQIGEYKVVGKFTMSDGSSRSVRADFEVIDPFNPPDPTDEEIIGYLVWRRLEDAFDSEEGGPWLQDVTAATFKKEKMQLFITEALFDINQQNPPTAETISAFVLNGAPTGDSPVLIQGVLLSVIRHLIRSYVEQPQPMVAQVVYEDRRDYLTRWQSLLQDEEARYARWVALWKRQFLGLGDTRTLVSSKAGRLIPAPMRTRWVGRGYW